MSGSDIGPVETLARLAIQSNRYRDDAEFRDAVDAVIGQPIYDAAPDLKQALEVLYEEATNFSVSGVYFDEKCMGHKGPNLALAALAKANGND